METVYQFFCSVKLIGDWDLIWDAQCRGFMFHGHGGHLQEMVCRDRGTYFCQAQDVNSDRDGF